MGSSVSQAELGLDHTAQARTTRNCHIILLYVVNLDLRWLFKPGLRDIYFYFGVVSDINRNQTGVDRDKPRN